MRPSSTEQCKQPITCAGIDSSNGTSTEGAVSIATAARQLGVSRWTVLRMIANGELGAVHVDRDGRRALRVRLHGPGVADVAAPPPRGLVMTPELMQNLTLTLDRLTTMLIEANQERAALRHALQRHQIEAEPSVPKMPPLPPVRSHALQQHQIEAEPGPVDPPDHGPPPRASEPDEDGEDGDDTQRPALPTVYVRVPPMRPNPMTHPVEVLMLRRTVSRDQLLRPIRELYRVQPRRWWQRLPLMSRA